MTELGAVDISPAFREWLTTDPALDGLLGYDVPCEGTDPVTREHRIHRGYAPEQDSIFLALEKLGKNEPCESLLETIKPYIWYSTSDETDAPCIGGIADSRPVSVEFAVEIVAFQLQDLNAIARAFTDRIHGLNVMPCDPMPCVRGITFQKMRITSASDDYEASNIEAERLGAFTRFLIVTLWPLWG